MGVLRGVARVNGKVVIEGTMTLRWGRDRSRSSRPDFGYRSSLRRANHQQDERRFEMRDAQRGNSRLA
jgi:hypothetical protein